LTHVLPSTGRSLQQRYKEHFRDLKTGINKSNFARYLLDHGHSLGPTEDTISTLRIIKRVGHTNTLEKYIIYAETNNNQINDENTISANLLFDAIVSNDVYQ
jgi:hypothetical protein